MKAGFTKNLLRWNKTANHREMPWKGEKDPYRIWLSEVMLQQTRVEQGLGYYQRFIKAFPTVEALASAPESKVFKLWEGLGYYSRCRNLIGTARLVAKELGGRFPADYEGLIRLKGIGPYTASAIASFAYGEPRAVVDGNVQRVLARYFGLTMPVDTTEAKKMFLLLAQSLLDKDAPGVYNQAIMDFGATVCRPRNPLCGQCCQAKTCEAFRHGYAEKLPVKSKKTKKTTRWFYYFVLEVGDSVYIRRREARDIWQHLYEFVLYERDEPEDDPAGPFLKKALRGLSYTVVHPGASYSQQLSHQHIRGAFWVVKLSSPASLPEEFMLVKRKHLQQYAFPKCIHAYLNEAYLPLR